MRFGLQINPYSRGTSGNVWDAVASAARLVDAGGFHSVWVYDHVLYEGGYGGHPQPEPALECFTTLGAIAAITQRVRLGQLVTAVPYRNPALVVKMATTLDHISHGRAILGLGAGWHQREHEAYGWGAFEPGPVRLKRLEEALRLTHAQWTERPASFEGAYYHLGHVLDDPPPIQQPHPPILVGGSGERVTLRLAAQYADMSNVSGSPERVSQLFQALRGHCEKLGRDPESVVRSVYLTTILGRTAAEAQEKTERYMRGSGLTGVLAGTPDQVIALLQDYDRAGCQYAIIRMLDWEELEPIRLFAKQVIPALATA